MSRYVLLLALVQTVFNIGGAGLIKSELGEFALDGFHSYVQFLTRSKTLAGIVLIGIGFIATIKLLSLTKLSVLIPLTSGVSFVVAAGIAAIFLGERITITTVAGMALIFVGIYVLGQQ